MDCKDGRTRQELTSDAGPPSHALPRPPSLPTVAIEACMRPPPGTGLSLAGTPLWLSLALTLALTLTLSCASTGQEKASNIRASEAYADPSTTSRPDLRHHLTADELELICDGCNMTAAAWVRRGGGSSAAAPAKLGAACTKQAWTKHCYNCRIANGVKAASANGR